MSHIMNESKKEIDIQKLIKMRRLTDLWSNLLSHSQRDPDATLAYRDRMQRADEIKERFTNLYWTRIIAVSEPDGE